MEDMRKLKDMLCRELDEFSRRDSIESYDLDTIHKLTDTINNLDEMLEYGGYSQARGGGNRGGMRTYARDGEGGGYGYEDSFGDNDGYSMARRRRDERGRYSRDDGRDDMVNRLEEMMSRAGSDRDREEIRRMIERMKGM
jgi:hypothetical protein